MYQKIFSKKFHKNERGQKLKRGKIVINKIYHFTAFLVMALSRSTSVAVFSEDNNGVFTIDDYTQSIKDAHKDDVVDSFCQSVVFLAELEGPFNEMYKLSCHHSRMIIKLRRCSNMERLKCIFAMMLTPFSTLIFLVF